MGKQIYEQLKTKREAIKLIGSGRTISSKECYELVFAIYSTELAVSLDINLTEEFGFRLAQCLAHNLSYQSFLVFISDLRGGSNVA